MSCTAPSKPVGPGVRRSSSRKRRAGRSISGEIARGGAATSICRTSALRIARNDGGGDPAPRVEHAGDLEGAGTNRPDQVVEDLVGHVLVEDAHVPVGDEVEL